MSSKSDKDEKVFNGGSLVDWLIIRDLIELEADRQNCKYQLVYGPEDIVGDSVIEAVFIGQRICQKGQEQEFVEESVGQQILAVQGSAGAKRQRIEALNYGVGPANALQRSKDLNAVDDKESEDVARLEQSKFKLVLDTQAAGARYDADFRQFGVDRAKAISILRKYLGPNPRNNISKELTELKPRAAWKKLADIYASDAANANHLNTTTKLMSELVFDLKCGDVSEHMGVLDKLNETLVAAGKGKDDVELLNYLTSSMERSKDGAMYKTTLDVLSVIKTTKREDVLDALRTVELKAKAAETLKGKHTIAGARFGKVEFAGSASSEEKNEKEKERVVARRTKPSITFANLCVKCCKTDHRSRECKENVVCGYCRKTNHCEKYCFMKNPSLRSAQKANTANVESEESTEPAEKDITKVTTK